MIEPPPACFNARGDELRTEEEVAQVPPRAAAPSTPGSRLRKVCRSSFSPHLFTSTETGPGLGGDFRRTPARNASMSVTSVLMNWTPFPRARHQPLLTRCRQRREKKTPRTFWRAKPSTITLANAGNRPPVMTTVLLASEG